MRYELHKSASRLFLAAVSALAGAGCSLDSLRSVSAPAPLEVAGYVQELRAGADAVKGMTPREYVTASIVYSNQKCREFFITLAESQRDQRLIDKLLNAAAAAGNSLLPVHNATARGQAVFTAGITTALALNEGVREIYGFGPYANEIANKVTESQNVYLSAMSTKDSLRIISAYSSRELRNQLSVSITGNTYAPIPSVDLVINIDQVTRDEAMLLARYVAQGYAYQCSVANINNLVRASIATAQIVNVAASGAAGGGSLSQAVPSPVGTVTASPSLTTRGGGGGGGGRIASPRNGGGFSAPPKTTDDRQQPSGPVSKPPAPVADLILGAQTQVEQKISLGDGLKIQSALCVGGQANGDFGPSNSPTREAIRQYQTVTGKVPSGVLSAEQDVKQLLTLGPCNSPYMSIYERLTLDHPGKIAAFHVDLLKAMQALRNEKADKTGALPPPVDPSLLTDEFGKQNQIMASTRTAMRLVQQARKLPDTGTLNRATHNAIRNTGSTF